MLVDTHAWLFAAANDPARLGRAARRRIDRARDRGELVVSVASMFEVAALCAAGRLQLVPSAEAWMRQAIAIGRMQVSEVTSAIAIEAGSIPTTAVPDPVDRLLVATARSLSVPIVTRDAKIRAYIEGQGFGSVIDVSK